MAGKGQMARAAGAWRRGPSALLALLLLAAPAIAEVPDPGWLVGDPGQRLDVRGMTFVASEGGANEIVLRAEHADFYPCLLYTSPSPRDRTRSRMPSSA